MQEMFGKVRPLDGRPCSEVMVDNDSLEVVDSFCYLGDMLSLSSALFAAANGKLRPQIITKLANFLKLANFGH